MTPITLSATTSLYGDSLDLHEMRAHVGDLAKLAQHLPAAIESAAIKAAFDRKCKPWADALHDKWVADCVAHEITPRFHQTNRVHDVHEMATTAIYWAQQVTRLRVQVGKFYTKPDTDLAAWVRRHEWSRRGLGEWGGGFAPAHPRTEAPLLDAAQDAEGIFETVVHQLATRFICVALAVVRNSPPEDRDAVFHELASMEHATRAIVAGLQAGFVGPHEELSRMLLGPGQAELAVDALHLLVRFAIDKVLALPVGTEGSYVHGLQARARMAEREMRAPFEFYSEARRHWQTKLITNPTDAARPGIEGVVMQLHERVPEVLAQRMREARPARFVVIAGK